MERIHIARLGVQLYLRFMVIVLAGFSLTGVGVVVVTQSTQTVENSPNPFLEYTDIFPGQSSGALKGRTLSCVGTYNYSLPSDTSCSFDVKSAMFSRIETTISNGIIRQISFTLRGNTLKIGNLILLFGKPYFRSYPSKVFFFWRKLFVTVSTTATGYPAAMRPAWSVTFTDVN